VVERLSYNLKGVNPQEGKRGCAKSRVRDLAEQGQQWLHAHFAPVAMLGNPLYAFHTFYGVLSTSYKSRPFSTHS
jgi:hypothetical protein